MNVGTMACSVTLRLFGFNPSHKWPSDLRKGHTTNILEAHSLSHSSPWGPRKV
jgi:hypothetical protein